MAVAGGVQWLVLGDAPGLQWFVARLIIATFFTLIWSTFAGRDRAAAVGGAIALAFVLLTYTHFLGPVGLPDTDLRLIGPDSPPTTAHWLSYTEEWLMVFPVTLAVALVAFMAVFRWHQRGWSPLRLSRGEIAGAAVAVLAVLAVATIAGFSGGPDNHEAVVVAQGDAAVDVGTLLEGDFVPAEGTMRFTAQDRNPRMTPLPPHDDVELVATLDHPDGRTYRVTAAVPLVNDPRGRFTTWGGVGFDKWHHGRSEVGTSTIPATRSEVAVYALGDVYADDELLATDVSVHAMTVPDAGVELHVGDQESTVAGIPGGQLRVIWPDRDGQSPESHQRSHNALGGVVLLTLGALAMAALRNRPEGP